MSLPNGLSFGVGPLGGTPAAGTAGSYTITLSASNSVGSVAQSFTLMVAMS